MQAVQVVIQVEKATRWRLGATGRWDYSDVIATDGVGYIVAKKAGSRRKLPSPGQLCKLELYDNEDLRKINSHPTYRFTIL